MGTLVVSSLVFVRSAMINMDRETTDRLIASAKSCQSEFPYNPLGFGDYLGVFLFGKSIDPSISIVDLRRDGGGYLVTFYGYKDDYRAMFHLSKAFEVIVAGIDYKRKM